MSEHSHDEESSAPHDHSHYAHDHTEGVEPCEAESNDRRESLQMGFLCPACDSVVKFESEELLRNHWAAFHDEEGLMTHSGAIKPKQVLFSFVLFRKFESMLCTHSPFLNVDCRRSKVIPFWQVFIPHQFEEQHWTAPRQCDFCDSYIWRSGKVCKSLINCIV